MNELIKRARFITVIVSVLVIIATIFLIFNPIKASLLDKEIKNYTTLCSSKFSEIESEVSRCKEGSDSLSSRTMIAQKIAEYNSGTISLNDLVEFTKSKYEDGAKVLNYLVCAVRNSDGETIAHYDSTKHIKISDSIVDSCDMNNLLEYIAYDNMIYLKIITEVVSDGKSVGADILYFDFSSIVESISDENVSADVVSSNQYDVLINESKTIKDYDGERVVETKDSVFWLKKLDENIYISLSTDREKIYSEIMSVMTRIVVSWFSLLVGIYLAIYLLFFRFAKKKFILTEKSVRKLKSELNTDKLTGAFSRTFLDVWNNKIRKKSKKYSLVMTDVDNFKQVNDKYGHLIGDDVLKSISNAMLNTVRNDDYLIRYGGDEFLMLLNETDEEGAEIIVKRALENVAQIKGFSFELSFSYGISELDLSNDLSNSIEEADKKMYADKKKQKNKLQ